MSNISISKFNTPIPGNPRPLDSATVRGFDQTSKSINGILSLPIVNGVLISGVALPMGTNVTIEHKLGRPWIGWFVADLVAGSDAANQIRRGTTTPELDRKFFLELRSTNAVTVAVWVY